MHPNRSETLKRIVKNKHCYIFISPFFVLFLIFFVYPIFYSLRISFYSFRGIRAANFIGLQNYIDLVQDELFYNSLANTLFIWVLFIPLVLFFALTLATFLDTAGLRLNRLYNLTIFMPIVTSTVVMSLVFYIIFQRNGLLNYFLAFLRVPAVGWLNSYIWSKPAIVMTMLWRWTGYYTILLFAGMQSIDRSLYEAARIDGATSAAIFFKIRIPLLVPMIIFCLIIGSIDVLQQFTEPYLLTKGGPGTATTTIGLYLYNTAFKHMKIGYAASMGYVLILFFIILAFINVRIRRQK